MHWWHENGCIMGSWKMPWKRIRSYWSNHTMEARFSDRKKHPGGKCRHFYAKGRRAACAHRWLNILGKHGSAKLAAQQMYKSQELFPLQKANGKRADQTKGNIISFCTTSDVSGYCVCRQAHMIDKKSTEES